MTIKHMRTLIKRDGTRRDLVFGIPAYCPECRTIWKIVAYPRANGSEAVCPNRKCRAVAIDVDVVYSDGTGSRRAYNSTKKHVGAYDEVIEAEKVKA